MKVLGVVGSQRKRGNTSSLVQEALKPLEREGFEAELLFLSEYEIKSCRGCEECKETLKCVLNDDMQKIYPLMLEADAVILGSPTYFYNVSADMKVFLDRCYCFEVFAEDDRSVWVGINEIIDMKYAVVISVCEQHREEDMGYTPQAMSRSLEALGYRVVDTVKAFGFFKAGEVLRDEEVMKKARRAGEKLYKTIKLKNDMKNRLEIEKY